jgi:hypothetical protein
MSSLRSAETLCLAGLARCDITPPVGIYHRMWGAATHDRSTGVHRPLTATALTLHASPDAGDSQQNEACDVVFLAVDHCLLWAKEMKTLLERVSAAADVPREQLFVMFSHTHGAGLMGLERAELPGGELIGPYLEDLAAKLADIVRQARASLQPAVITYGRGRCSLAANRDQWDEANQRWVCGHNAGGFADDTLVVARIADLEGRALGAVVNYACHPTTLAWENTLISPDYVGAMRELVEQNLDAPCFFIQGASGDLGPRVGFVGDTAVADSNGRQLGYAALAALEALPPARTQFEYVGPVISGATIGAWKYAPESSVAAQTASRWRQRTWTVVLEYRPGIPTAADDEAERARHLAAEQAARAAGDEAKARDCRAQAEIKTRQLVRIASLPPGPIYPFPVHLWQMGDAIWLALEAEHYQLLQRNLRDGFPNTTIIVATLVNGSLHSYLPPRELYGTGVYQETVALLAPGSLERLIDEIGAQIASWKRS